MPPEAPIIPTYLCLCTCGNHYQSRVCSTADGNLSPIDNCPACSKLSPQQLFVPFKKEQPVQPTLRVIQGNNNPIPAQQVQPINNDNGNPQTALAELQSRIANGEAHGVFVMTTNGVNNFWWRYYGAGVPVHMLVFAFESLKQVFINKWKDESMPK